MMFSKNKKAILGALLFIFGIYNQVSAQGLTIKIGGGYNFPIANMVFGYNITSETITNASTQTTTTTQEVVYMSLGKSLNLGARIGYMFSANVGIDFGIDYALGLSTKFTEKYASDKMEFPSGKFETVNSISGNRFLISPSLVLSAGDKTVSPYARLGLGIGLTTCVMEDTFSSSYVKSGITTTYTSEVTTELTNKIGLGFAGAVGVDFKVSDMLGFYGELNVVTLNVKAESSEITKSIKNGQDMLPSMDPTQRIKIYLDSKTTTTNSDDPQPVPTSEYVGARLLPFSSFGINVGLKLSF